MISPVHILECDYYMQEVVMGDFFILIGQIFAVSIIQLVLEVLIDSDKHFYQAAVINTACFLGSLYFLLDFLFNKVLADLSTMVPSSFF